MTRHDDASTFADVLAHFSDKGTKELFRELLEQALQYLIGAEVTAKIGAGWHERIDYPASSAVCCSARLKKSGSSTQIVSS